MSRLPCRFLVALSRQAGCSARCPADSAMLSDCPASRTVKRRMAYAAGDETKIRLARQFGICILPNEAGQRAAGAAHQGQERQGDDDDSHGPSRRRPHRPHSWPQRRGAPRGRARRRRRRRRKPPRRLQPSGAKVASIDAIIADRDIDAVLICTPDRHACRPHRGGRARRQGGVLRKARRPRPRTRIRRCLDGREGARHAADDRLQPPLRSEFRRRCKRASPRARSATVEIVTDHVARSRARRRSTISSARAASSAT